MLGCVVWLCLVLLVFAFYVCKPRDVKTVALFAKGWGCNACSCELRGDAHLVKWSHLSKTAEWRNGNYLVKSVADLDLEALRKETAVALALEDDDEPVANEKNEPVARGKSKVFGMSKNAGKGVPVLGLGRDKLGKTCAKTIKETEHASS